MAMNPYIAFIIREATAQGRTARALNRETGYNTDQLGRMKRGEITHPRIHMVEDYLNALGYELKIVKKEPKNG